MSDPTLARAVEIALAISFLVLGLSHMLQPRAWIRFFMLLHSKGEAGIFFNAFLHLIPGLLIVSFHNVWSGIPVVLTIIGWGYVIKSTIYFVAPQLGVRALGTINENSGKKFIIAGGLLIALSALLTYSLVMDWRESLA